MESDLWRQMRKEVEEEISAPPPVEEYCTEYDGNFQIRGFLPKDPSNYQIDPETVKKFPLYRSQAVTFWTHRLSETISDISRVPGKTQSAGIDKDFQKVTKFTKPIQEVLDVDPNMFM